MAAATDTFTDTDAVLLQSHVGESGAWAKIDLGGLDPDIEIMTNRIRPISKDPTLYVLTGTPPESSAQSVEADVRIDGSKTAMYAGPAARVAAASQQRYQLRTTIDDLELDKVSSGGSRTTLGSYAHPSTLQGGAEVTLILNALDESKKALLGAVERISSADNVYTGYSGRWGLIGNETSTQALGTVEITTWRASDIGGNPVQMMA